MMILGGLIKYEGGLFLVFNREFKRNHTKLILSYCYVNCFEFYQNNS
jgi:hypothetical protein